MLFRSGLAAQQKDESNPRQSFLIGPKREQAQHLILAVQSMVLCEKLKHLEHFHTFAAISSIMRLNSRSCPSTGPIAGAASARSEQMAGPTSEGMLPRLKQKILPNPLKNNSLPKKCRSYQTEYELVHHLYMAAQHRSI